MVNLYVLGSEAGDYTPAVDDRRATDEEILAQPCVVEALRMARERAIEEAAQVALTRGAGLAAADCLVECADFATLADDIRALITPAPSDPPAAPPAPTGAARPALPPGYSES